MWSYWARKIGVWLVIAVALVMSPIIMMQIVDGDLFTLSLYVAGLAGIFFILQPVAKQWIYIVCLVSVMASINFLPVNFSFFELAVLMVAGHFVIEHVVMRHRGLRYGHLVIVGCIAAIAGILLYHWFKQGIGFKILGGDEVGARKNFSAIMGCVAYALIVTLGKGQWQLLNRVPLLYFLTSLFFLMPFVLTTYFPATTPYIYRFISNINFEAYQADKLNLDTFGRIGQLGTFGAALAIFLISRFPMRHWWRPERWWVALLFLTAFALCLRSGFRSSVFTFICIAAIGAYLSIGIKSVWMGLLGLLMVGILAIGHGTFFELPLSVQRAMTFVPGRWDVIATESAASSNDFRQTIKDIYTKEYLRKSPMLGNGFNYKKSELYALNYDFGISSYGMTPYDFHKGFIARKDFHVGWISLYDAVGIAGGLFFILLFVTNVWLLYKASRHFPKNHLPPILIWITVMMVPSFISFFAVFGAFQQMLPLMCVLSALTYLVYEYAKQQKNMAAGGVVDAELPRP